MTQEQKWGGHGRELQLFLRSWKVLGLLCPRLPPASRGWVGSGSLIEEGTREDSVAVVAPLLALLRRRGPEGSGAAIAGGELPLTAGHGGSCGAPRASRAVSPWRASGRSVDS